MTNRNKTVWAAMLVCLAGMGLSSAAQATGRGNQGGATAIAAPMQGQLQGQGQMLVDGSITSLQGQFIGGDSAGGNVGDVTGGTISNNIAIDNGGSSNPDWWVAFMAGGAGSVVPSNNTASNLGAYSIKVGPIGGSWPRTMKAALAHEAMVTGAARGDKEMESQGRKNYLQVLRDQDDSSSSHGQTVRTGSTSVGLKRNTKTKDANPNLMTPG